MEIGIVGKYVDLRESYKSLHEALVHGGLANEVQVALTYIDSERVEREGAEGLLGHLHGILVPGGFGVRGVEGKIQAIRYAREHRIPYFGICFGMQLAVIEFARHLAGITDATSEEFDPEAADPVIYLMREWYDYRRDAIIRRDRESEKGGTMRLGAYPCVLKEESLAGRAYAPDPDHGTPPPPLRIQQRLPGEAERRRPGASPAPPPTASWWRSSRSRTIPGSWAASSTRSSNPAPWTPTPCSGTTSGPPWNISSARSNPTKRFEGQ